MLWTQVVFVSKDGNKDLRFQKALLVQSCLKAERIPKIYQFDLTYNFLDGGNPSLQILIFLWELRKI